MEMSTQAFVVHDIHDLNGLFGLLARSDQPVYISGEGVQGILLRYQAYQAMQTRLEDLEDRLAMRAAEAEYRAGEGRPFDDILAEIEAEETAHVPG